jgi:low affinity Fe/Cu permease
MLTILVVILILMLLGALPTWPYSRQWGYYPTGALGTIILILLMIVLLQRGV